MDVTGRTVENMWQRYVREVAQGESVAQIGKRAGVAGPTVSRWFSIGSMPDAPTIAKLARSYGRPVLEAFVAAGLLSADEAGERPAAPLSLDSLSDEELLAEVMRRMQRPSEEPVQVSTRQQMAPAARRARSRGKQLQDEADARGEESQDGAGMDPA